MPSLCWKIWDFEAGDDYDLPCGCVGLRRKRECEPDLWDYMVCCPMRISNPQAQVIFKGVRNLRHSRGCVYKWCIIKYKLLEELPDSGFEECEHISGPFQVPKIKPGRPRTTPVKVPGLKRGRPRTTSRPKTG